MDICTEVEIVDGNRQELIPTSDSTVMQLVSLCRRQTDIAGKQQQQQRPPFVSSLTQPPTAPLTMGNKTVSSSDASSFLLWLHNNVQPYLPIHPSISQQMPEIPRQT